MPVEVVAIFGPTASGKSEVAEGVARLLDTEVVSADAMQVYRGLPLLTNQPAHSTRLVAICELDEQMSVAEYARRAHAEIDELVAARGAVVVAGGTGLYLRAALADLRLPPPPPDGARARWEARYDEDPAAVFATLEARDPAAAMRVHENDRRRVVRALELTEAGASLAPESDRLWSGAPRLPTLVFGLDVEPAELHRRIVARATAMFAQGVEAEVRAALLHGVSTTAEQALGLREIAELPAGEAQASIVARTRKYAAYQRKWMRRIPGISILDGTRPASELAHAIVTDAVT
jgi:tRNA dimethylallyltransferase